MSLEGTLVEEERLKRAELTLKEAEWKPVLEDPAGNPRMWMPLIRNASNSGSRIFTASFVKNQDVAGIVKCLEKRSRAPEGKNITSDKHSIFYNADTGSVTITISQEDLKALGITVRTKEQPPAR